MSSKKILKEGTIMYEGSFKSIDNECAFFDERRTRLVLYISSSNCT